MHGAMRLLDRVAHTRFRDTMPTKAGSLAVEEPQALQRKLGETPIRYVLADDVAAFCLRMMAEEPDFLLTTRDLVRAPAPLLWLEWNDTLCRQMLRELGIIPAFREEARFTRAGCLVESDESGRRGRLTSFWATHAEDTTVEVSPFALSLTLTIRTIGFRRAPPTTRSVCFWKAPARSTRSWVTRVCGCSRRGGTGCASPIRARIFQICLSRS